MAKTENTERIVKLYEGTPWIHSVMLLLREYSIEQQYYLDDEGWQLDKEISWPEDSLPAIISALAGFLNSEQKWQLAQELMPDIFKDTFGELPIEEFKKLEKEQENMEEQVDAPPVDYAKAKELYDEYKKQREELK